MVLPIASIPKIKFNGIALMFFQLIFARLSHVLVLEVNHRYQNWDTKLGKNIQDGSLTLDDLAQHAESQPEPKPISGRQEKLEGIVNAFIYN